MTVQRNAVPLSQAGDAAGPCPHPVSLETMELIQQALGEMLQALRRKAHPRSGPDAGAIEYASWMPLIR